jgi:hypothetical protein
MGMKEVLRRRDTTRGRIRMDLGTNSHGLGIDVAWTLDGDARASGRTRMGFGSRSHEVWGNVAWTLGRGRMDLGSMSHGLWIDVARGLGDVARTLDGSRTGLGSRLPGGCLSGNLGEMADSRLTNEFSMPVICVHPMDLRFQSFISTWRFKGGCRGGSVSQRSVLSAVFTSLRSPVHALGFPK